MTEAQLTGLVTEIPITELISLLSAIGNRNFSHFQQLESDFTNRYGIDIWEEYFNFRLLPTLDNTSNKWLLKQMLDLAT